MAKEREDIAHRHESTSSEDNEEDYEGLRVLAVIENSGNGLNKSYENINNVTRVTKPCSEENNVSVKAEVILLDEAPTAQTSGDTDPTRITKFRNNPRVIELSDDKSKMELRREFKVDVAHSELTTASEPCVARMNNDDESADILSRLPPGTILIKQSANRSANTSAAARTSAREDSDYIHDSSKDSTGTNSSESSGAASYDGGSKVRRMQYRSVRSKKIVEVRRNPVRNKKKKPIDEDFARPRQRLLEIKRKPSYVVENLTRKRARAAPTPYMNTRSVTRKMYTVGATYQAPTVNDALEWKEWPSHGMHERPIWHPQVGLAYEYNERSFVSLDGENYREIIEDPVIEVVSVDPHPERMSMSYPGRNFERMRYYSAPRSLELVNKRETYVQGNSFQACMHGSFHSVMAYCARVVAPTYKRNVDMKISTFSGPEHNPDHKKPGVKPPSLKKFSQEPAKLRIPSLVIPASGTGPPVKVPETSGFLSTGTSNEAPKCLVIPRKTIHFTNVRNIQGNILQEVFNRSSKNTLIFLKPTDPPGKAAEKIAAALKSSTPKINPSKTKDLTEPVTSQLNLTKLDDNAISDEALMEMSSMYNNLLPSDENESGKGKFLKANHYANRAVTALVATKIPMKSSSELAIENPGSKTPRASGSGYRGGNHPGPINPEATNQTRFAYSNQAAEIAKILAEYNQKAAKNSGLRNTCYTPANILNLRTTASTKTVKMMNQCVSSTSSRNSLTSIVEQPKNHRFKREPETPEARNCRSFNVNRQIFGQNLRAATATVTSELDEERKNDDNQAMDLTTAKPRETKAEIKADEKSEGSRKWLQELIEDTAILYCAAAGVNQGDVAEYMNTLDSVQNLQWLGS